MKITIYAATFFIAAAFSGCGPNQSILESGKQNTSRAANVSIKRSSMEQDLEAMRTAQFSVIFVLRRKDGGEFDADDRAVVRTNTSQANRRVAADDGRAIIVGSNFPIPPENMNPMQERFLIEVHSPPSGSANSNVDN